VTVDRDHHTSYRYVEGRRSLIGLPAGLLVGQTGDSLRAEVLLSGVDHPSNSQKRYLAALEKVVALTPLILPSAVSCSLIVFGLT
jgi:hypothetical protein